MTEEELKENQQIKEDDNLKEELSDKKETENKAEDNDSDNNNKSSWLKEIRSYAIIIVAAVLVAIFVNTFIISNTRVPTGSMENTIMCGNRLCGN